MHILKKVMIVVAGLDLADILVVLASFELIPHSVLHFRNVDQIRFIVSENVILFSDALWPVHIISF